MSSRVGPRRMDPLTQEVRQLRTRLNELARSKSMVVHNSKFDELWNRLQAVLDPAGTGALHGGGLSAGTVPASALVSGTTAAAGARVDGTVDANSQIVVNHGLGAVPRIVSVTPMNTGMVNAAVVNDTSITVRFLNTAGANLASGTARSFYWMAAL